jgi:hypothetical protein
MMLHQRRVFSISLNSSISMNNSYVVTTSILVTKATITIPTEECKLASHILQTPCKIKMHSSFLKVNSLLCSTRRKCLASSNSLCNRWHSFSLSSNSNSLQNSFHPFRIFAIRIYILQTLISSPSNSTIMENNSTLPVQITEIEETIMVTIKITAITGDRITIKMTRINSKLSFSHLHRRKCQS